MTHEGPGSRNRPISFAAVLGQLDAAHRSRSVQRRLAVQHKARQQDEADEIYERMLKRGVVVEEDMLLEKIRDGSWAGTGKRRT